MASRATPAPSCSFIASNELRRFPLRGLKAEQRGGDQSDEGGEIERRGGRAVSPSGSLRFLKGVTQLMSLLNLRRIGRYAYPIAGAFVLISAAPARAQTVVKFSFDS